LLGAGVERIAVYIVSGEQLESKKSMESIPLIVSSIFAESRS
jgi:hypothetical protein